MTTLQDAADELDPVDNLYEANEKLHATVAELARHNQELSLALSAAERRVKEAEQEVIGAQRLIDDVQRVSEILQTENRNLTEQLSTQIHTIEHLETENDSLRRRLGKWQGDFEDAAFKNERLETENQILQRTAELQLALVTATADVVEAARKHANDETPVGHLRAAIAAFDKAQSA